MNSSKFLSMLVVMGLVVNTALPMDMDSHMTGLAQAAVNGTSVAASEATETVAQVTVTQQARETIARLAGSAWKTAKNVVVLAQDHPYVSAGAVATVTLGATTYVVTKTGAHKPVVDFVSAYPRLAFGSAVAATAIGGAAAAQYTGAVDVRNVRNVQLPSLNRPSWMRMPSFTLPKVSLDTVKAAFAKLPMPSVQNAAIGTGVAAVIGGTAIAHRKGLLAAPVARVTDAASTASSYVVPVTGDASASAVAPAAVTIYTNVPAIERAIEAGEFANAEASIKALKAAGSVKARLTAKLEAKKQA